MNFLFPRKSCLSGLIVTLLFLSACQGLKTREDAPPKRPGVNPSVPVQTPPTHPHSPPPPPPSSIEVSQIPELPPQTSMPEVPRIGIILSGGGAKTFAHLGFLQELGRQKIAIHSIAGIEFSSPIAALYANKEMANDVEWQMFKIKDDDLVKKSLLSSSTKPGDMTQLSDFIKTSFARLKVEDFKLPFACPAFNMAKNNIYLMSRGGVDSLLPYCWPYPPFFKPYKSNVSAIREVKMLADYLRSKGANYIIFVNALAGVQSKPYSGDVTSAENIMWSEIATQYSRSQPGVDAILPLNTEAYGIMDFNKRREIMQKGADSASKTLKNIVKRWGL